MSQRGLFYGWVVVFAAATVVALGQGSLFSLGVFLKPLEESMRWSRSAVSVTALIIISAGGGAGMLLLAPLTRWITSAYDWRVAMIVLGDLAWLVVIPVALLVKNAPADMGAIALGGAATRQRDFSTREVLRAPQFWAIALTHFACCAAHAGPIFHMVTHAIDQGVTAMVAATVLGVSGLASIGGRIAGGMIAHRFGAKPTRLAGVAP